MQPSRRTFLRQSVAVSAAFSGLPLLSACASAQSDGYINQVQGYGPLVPDPSRLFDLPAGFEYVTFSDTGEEMDDGLLVPGDHDGMACFAGPGDLITLVRNHELGPDETRLSPFGADAERFGQIDPAKCYDTRPDGKPHLGGTTTVHFDPRRRAVVRQFLSLAGTEDNCAGGPTPWGSWITCEETRARAGQGGAKDHGYAFEVPADAQGLVTPVPLIQMGRFNREAVAVDPETSIVYQTEDDRPSLITRFIPDVPGDLTQPGRLQALAVLDRPGVNTNNWPDNPERIEVGQPMSVAWIDVADPANPDNRMAEHTIAAGAASFTRGEGMWFGEGEVFFCCTDGGAERIGQIWRYRPSTQEGRPGEASSPGELTLLVESTSRQILEKCDNITVAPWGDLIVVEDGDAEQYIRGVTPAGEVYTIGRNASPDASGEYSEITGPCFSPDGSLLFFNVQNGPGRTFAVSGPWAQRSPAPV
ncbi:PhoX family protein [Maricaulaceae bacterium EIL42A08]|nr:PhoX family protein [Maricaulaceae bacterium EIL42A08]